MPENLGLRENTVSSSHDQLIRVNLELCAITTCHKSHFVTKKSCHFYRCTYCMYFVGVNVS